jgi:predicted RNA-binding protein YlqC (UPF0109 family)
VSRVASKCWGFEATCGGTVTANKDFKKLVRQRMQTTGLSYAAARRVLHRQEQEPKNVPTREELHQTMAAMQAAIRDILTPLAEAYDRPFDPGIVSAVMFDREPVEDDAARRWVVHLYSLSPGLVIGRKGDTATAMRNELCRVSGDDGLRLNIIDFAKVHENRARLWD